MNKPNELYVKQLRSFIDSQQNGIADCELQIATLEKQVALMQKHITLQNESIRLSLIQIAYAEKSIIKYSSKS